MEPTCLMLKATSVPQVNPHSQYSSPVKALNFIVESKSLPAEVNNSTIELHLPFTVKKKIPLSRGVEYVMDGSMDESVSECHTNQIRSTINSQSNFLL